MLMRKLSTMLRRRKHRLLNDTEISRLQAQEHRLAPVLADVLRDWQVRATIEDLMIERVERQRQEWLDMPDDSSANARFHDKHTIARACRASKPPLWAEVLYRIVKETKPKIVLELGTNLGISSAYLASAGRPYNAKVMTLDGAPSRVELARLLHGQLGLDNISYTIGRFQKTLPQVLDALPEIDFAFIDGHHHRDPTLSYFNAIYPRLNDGAVVVFDDIGWSAGMVEAWEILREDARFSFVIDLVNIGVCVTRAIPDDNKPPVFRVAPPLKS